MLVVDLWSKLSEHSILALVLAGVGIFIYRAVFKAVEIAKPMLGDLVEAHTKGIETVAEANKIFAETIKALGDAQVRIEGKIDDHTEHLEGIKKDVTHVHEGIEELKKAVG